MLRAVLFTAFLLPTAVLAQTPASAPHPASSPQPAAPKPVAPRPIVRKPAAAPAVAPPIAGLTDDEKLLYALGLVLQRSLQPFALTTSELEVVKRGLTDAALSRPAIDLDEWGPRIAPFARARGELALRREKAAATAYIAKSAAETGAVQTPSGLVYRELAPGTGASPAATDAVRVNYRGTLIDGTEFDSSYTRHEPAEFTLGAVIGCWTEGVQKMKVGTKARIVCPSDLAYGDAGAPTIPGGAALIFEIELLGIVNAPVR